MPEVFTDLARSMTGVCTELALSVYGACTELAWSVHGVFMEHTQSLHRCSPFQAPYVQDQRCDRGCTWRSTDHELSMHGVYMDSTMSMHGAWFSANGDGVGDVLTGSSITRNIICTVGLFLNMFD